MSPAVKFILVAFLTILPAIHGDDLTVGFYNSTCPSAETLVQQAVAQAFANNSGIAPGLIRMHFHDCFVRGCDGSVLINSTSNNTAERDAPPNNPSLRGFEVIDAAKTAVEAKCPQIVSCADILAFAARDSAALAGNITYQVPAGRRDGLISNSTEAINNLPRSTFNSTQLINNFANKNLTADEMVTLSGAHSIGISHCASFTDRLYNLTTNTSQVDPTMSSAYASLLQNKCPANSTLTTPLTVSMDLITPDVLDNQYYVGLQLGLGLMTSDQALLTDSNLSTAVKNNSNDSNGWVTKFTLAMVKMGNIEVLTGTQGEIRTTCSVINSAGFGSIVESGHLPGVASS